MHIMLRAYKKALCYFSITYNRSMERTWFIHENYKIRGPFSIETVFKNIENGEIGRRAYIWARGQKEWILVSEWEKDRKRLPVQSDHSRKRWKLKFGRKVLENLDFREILVELRKLNDYQWVSVSLQESEEWTPFYSSHIFMEALGLSRRRFPRVPLMGLAKITNEDSGSSYVVKTSTVGQGGLGVYGLGPSFVSGTKVKLKVESDDLSAVIRADGTVVYNTDQGFVGISFNQLFGESRETIVEYVKLFMAENHTPEKGKDSTQN